MRKRLISFILALIMIFGTGLDALAVGFSAANTKPVSGELVELGEKDGKVILGTKPRTKPRTKTKRSIKESFNRANSGGLEIGDEIVNAPVRGTGDSMDQKVIVNLKKIGLNGLDADTSNNKPFDETAVNYPLAIDVYFQDPDIAKGTVNFGSTDTKKDITIQIPSSGYQDLNDFWLAVPKADDPDGPDYAIRAHYSHGTPTAGKADKAITINIELIELPETKMSVKYQDPYGNELTTGLPSTSPTAKLHLAQDYSFELGTTSNEKTRKDFYTIIEGLDDNSRSQINSIGTTDPKLSIDSEGTDGKLTIGTDEFKVIKKDYTTSNGGDIVIQSQPKVLVPTPTVGNDGTPTLPAKPEGYVRLTFKADEVATDGIKGTFDENNAKDKQRVVDVKVGTSYTDPDVTAAINGINKPQAIDTTLKKVFEKWNPETSTLTGNAAASDDKTFNAVYTDKYTKDEIIPFLPDETVPDKGSDGKLIPADYIIATFQAEKDASDTALGKVTVGKKTGEVVVAKVKPGVNLSEYFKTKTQTTAKVPEIKVTPNANYGFTKWDPTLGTAQSVNPYVAKFVKDGQDIKENDPVPDGWHKVTVKQDDTIKANTVKTKYYAVKNSLSKDKLTDLTGKEATNHENPAWYDGGTKLGAKLTKDITVDADKTILAKADKKAVIIPDQDNPGSVPEGYVRVTFKPGEGKFGASDKKVFDVLKGKTIQEAQAANPALAIPTATANDANKEHKAWTAASKDYAKDLKDYTTALNANVEFTAKYEAKTFDENNVTGMVVKAQPDLTYVEGNATKGKLDLSKLVVTLTDKNGNTQDVSFNKLGDYGITTNPGNGTEMTVAGNNGKPVVLTKDKLTVNTNNLVVTKDNTTDPVIPFEPKDPKNPGDKEDENIPTVNPKDNKPIKKDDYVVVGFKADPENSGTLTLGKQANKAVISALVKKDTAWVKFTMPTTNEANNYVFWHWDKAPADNVADGQVRVATFIKSGDEIDPNDKTPLPNGYHKVTVAKGTGIADDTLFGKTYAVKTGDKLAQAKFPTLKVSDSAKFKNPAWNVENPWTVEVADKDLTFTANAVSTVFDKNNVTGMVVKAQPDLTYVEGNATKGKLDLSKLVVTLTDKNGNTQDVPFNKLGDYEITTNPKNGTAMTVDGNNGKPVVLTKGGLTANTNNLVVTKDNTTEEKSEKPIIDQPTEGDDKITGEGKPGAKIVVKDKDGNKIGEAEVNDKGKWEVPVPKDKPLKENDKITVEQTEEGKKPNTDDITVKGKKTPTPPTPSRPSRPSTPTRPSTPDRVHGKDRVETAIEISKKYFRQANTVIVVDKKDFPDAMTASVLSKLLKAPILLTNTHKLDSRVAAEIQRLGAKDVIIVGGNSSVSDAVKRELAKFDKDTVERIYGKDRYETSAQVARRVVGITGKLGHAVVASGQVFADALAVAPYASREGYPILLVKANNLPKSIKDAITELAINKVTIAGGYATVNRSLEASLPTVVERLKGDTRYETAIDIANKKFSGSKEIFLANGVEWMDALVIGPVGGILDMPILLTRANSAPKSLEDYIAKANIQKVIAIGGTRMVSDSVLNELSK